MEKYELGLLENATDSLNEALLKYQEGVDGEEKAYKFCILHFSHFLELLFKYYVYKSHPLLIYKNPFAKNLNEDSYTIGLPEAIQFLKNEGKEISKEFSQDLDWVKKIRNSIEHHKFSMNVMEVEETIGRLLKTVYEFNASHSLIPNSESETGYQCTFCENNDSDEIEEECGICGVPFAKFFMSYTEEWGYICEHHF